jgi:Tfp pilus assembly protein PilF
LTEPSNAASVPAPRTTPGGEARPDHPAPPPARGKRSRTTWALLALLGLLALAGAGFWGWDRYQARREWREAQDALRRRDLAGAATHLDRYVARRPDDPGGWFLAARTARRRGQFADAGRYLDQYQKLGGAADSIHFERSLAFVQQGKLGEFDEDLRATIDPDHPDVLLVLEALARGYLIADRRSDARQACELWQALEPDHPWPWLCTGLISERLNQVDLAAVSYRRALELAPDDPVARIAFARILVRQRQPGPAAEHYEWVISRTPDDAEALLGLAVCRIEQGKAGEAVPLIDRVLSRDPAYPTGVYLRGKAAMELRDPSAAEGWLRRAVQLLPGDTEALYSLVLCLRALGKDAEADPFARQLEDLRQNLHRLQELSLKIGTKLEDATACHEAGVLALKVGRTREGVNLLREALRRKGDHRPTHAALAEYYRGMGSTDLADHHQRLAELP